MSPEYGRMMFQGVSEVRQGLNRCLIHGIQCVSVVQLLLPGWSMLFTVFASVVGGWQVVPVHT